MGHVPHLYLPGPWDAPRVDLSDDHGHHLHRVLRMRDGDEVSYSDGNGSVGQGRLVGRQVERGEERSRDRPSSLTVAVAPPDSRQRARYLVEKLAELGAARLMWIRTRRTEGRPPPEAKSSAWASAALEQSRGAWLLQIDRADLGDLASPATVVADPTGASTPPAAVRTLVVGPEGGFDPDELPAGVVSMSLGPTVLRVETAAVVGAVLLRSAGH